MQFFFLNALTTKTVSSEETDALQAQENSYAAAQLAAGFLKQVWLRGDTPGIAALVDGESEADVRAAFDKFPMKAAGLWDIEMLVPLQPYGEAS